MEDQEAELGEGNSILGFHYFTSFPVVPRCTQSFSVWNGCSPTPILPFFFLLLAPICPFLGCLEWLLTGLPFKRGLPKTSGKCACRI